MSQDWQRHTSFDDPGAERRFRESDRVSLLCDLPENGLVRGEAGTVVHAFRGAEAYLVEFVDRKNGSTRALVELSGKQVGPVLTTTPGA